MSLLDVQELSVRLGEQEIITNVSFSVNDGDWLMLVGPNGAGKSTVINAVSQSIPYKGSVLFDGMDLRKLKPRQRARLIGVLSQEHNVSYPFTVEEIVRLGRYPYSRNSLAKLSEEDERIIDEAIEVTGIRPFLKQPVTTLSGGEQQRTFLAQVFAQNPRLLILDEPVNHLDLVYQKQVFELVSKWLCEPGRALVSVVHDLSIAKHFGTRAVLMSRGVAISQGDATQVLTAENLDIVYSMDVTSWMKELFSSWN